MCAQHLSKLRKWKFNPAFIYLLAIGLGIICGFSHITHLENLGMLISDIFIKIFKCISLPVIALSLIVTLSQYTADTQMKGIWQRTFFYTLSTTLIAASISCLLYLLIAPSTIPITVDGISTLQNTHSQSYVDYLTQLIPANVLSPFLEQQVLSALLVSMVIGIAIPHIPDPISRNAITHFFRGTHGVFMVITSWIVKIIPIALFGFITTTIIQLKSNIHMRGLGGYLTILVLANIIQGVVVLPIFLYAHKIKPFVTLRGILPALSVAFFSKSSSGTLPVTMETAERNLNISPKISRLVLPLCTSINMNGCAAFIFTTVIYLMQNHGANIHLSTLLLWILIATIAAIGNAGVPMGCFFLSASLLTSMNVPISLMGLILPFYSIIDMVETALNVWSDACITKIIDERSKGMLSEGYTQAIH